MKTVIIEGKNVNKDTLKDTEKALNKAVNDTKVEEQRREEFQKIFDNTRDTTMTYNYAVHALNDLKRDSQKAKQKMLKYLYDEVINEGVHWRLLQPYAVQKNHGMDVCFDNLSQAKICMYIKMYVREIYCFDLSEIYLDEEY